MKNKINKKPTIDLNTLISKMTSEDKRNVRIMRNFQVLMWIMAPLYLIIFNIGTGNEITTFFRLGGVCFALAFLTLALILRNFYRTYKSVDYGVPTTEMLKKAVDRYQFKIKKIPLIILPIVLIDLGISAISLSSFESAFHNRIVYFQLIYWGLMSTSIFIGYLIWRKKQKPLRDAALAMLKEMEA